MGHGGRGRPHWSEAALIACVAESGVKFAHKLLCVRMIYLEALVDLSVGDVPCRQLFSF